MSKLLRITTLLSFLLLLTTCTPSSTGSLNTVGEKIRGVNLGGLFVLEPWIRPSLFDQFQGKNSKEEVAVDPYTFCQILGTSKANAQLRAHWSSWVTEDDIKKIASLGLNTIRLPIGDYMFRPYGPYTVTDTSASPTGDTTPAATDCFAGSLDYLDQVLSWSKTHGLTVYLDLHTTWGGQNGFDNGGQANDLTWLGEGNYANIDANWQSTGAYAHMIMPHWGMPNDPQLDQKRAHTLSVLTDIALRYSDRSKYPQIAGLEALNEPGPVIDMGWLIPFYRDAYKAIRPAAPDWKIIFHDSFRLLNWAGLNQQLATDNNVALSTHIYQAFDGSRRDTTRLAEGLTNTSRFLDTLKSWGTDVVVNEWSLAIDNCVLWINGFNSRSANSPNGCASVPCAERAPMSYKGNTISTVTNGLGPTTSGLCPTDNLQGIDLKSFAKNAVNTYETHSLGWVFWNFKTELDTPAWSYFSAVDKGYFPQDGSQLATWGTSPN